MGREPELERLLGALGDVVAGRGRLFLIAGEPGIGKTALAEELTARARDEGARVAWGRCWEGSSGAPAYWPWTQIVRGLLRELDSEDVRTFMGGGAPYVAQMVPELRELLRGLPEPPPGSPEVARFRLFDALGGFLRRMSGSRPMLVVLEDVHVADASSLLLLRFLAEEIRDIRLLLLATYRDVELTREDPLAAALPDLTGDRAARMSLSGLGSPDVARLIQGIVGRTPPEDLVEEIHRGTDGNPLFVRELVGLLSAEGRLEERSSDRRWPIPEGVRGLIGRRLDRLPASCRQLLVVGSVEGREFRVEVLERVSGRSVEDVLGELHAAVASRVVAPVEDDPGAFRFTHALVREVLYEDLLPADRVRAHRDVGEALEALYAWDPESHAAELAHHFFEAAPAGDPRKAVGYATAAGKRAVALLAYEEAVRVFRMALTALRESPDEERRCEVLLLLGDAEARAGDASASKETFLRAAEIATRLGRAAWLGGAALGYAGRFPWVRAGIDRHLIPLLTQALNALGPTDSVLRARLLARLAGALRDQPSMEPRASLAREAVAMARRIGDPGTLAYALLGEWAAAFMGPDGLEGHAALAEELDRLAREAGDLELAVSVHAFRFSTCMATGEVSEARAQYEIAGRLVGELQQPPQRWLVGLMATMLALNEGRFDDAERLIEETCEAGRRAQEWDAGAARLFALFMLRREQGRLAELEDEIRQAPGEYPGYRSLRCMHLAILCDLGRLDEARALFDQLAVDGFSRFPRDNEWLFALTLLAETAHALQDRDRGEILYEQLRRYPELVAWLASDASAGPVARPLGLLASLLGRPEDAAAHFEEAIDRAERMGSRPWAAHARFSYALMLAERDGAEDAARAADLLADVLETCERFGMVTLRRRVMSLMVRLGMHPSSRAGRGPQGTVLTPREREVALLLAEALSNRQIAERLYLSERTVESHVQRILAKLGMTSRTQVAVWALQEGLESGGG